VTFGALTGTQNGALLVKADSLSTLQSLTGSSTGTFGSTPILGAAAGTLATLTGASSSRLFISGAASAVFGSVLSSSYGQNPANVVARAAITLTGKTYKDFFFLGEFGRKQ